MKTNSTDIMRSMSVVLFWDKVDKKDPNSCWEYMGSRNGKGYGTLMRGSKSYLAHRFSYRIHYGNIIPEGIMICHQCDNPPCVNPYHLFMGTNSINLIDASSKGRLNPPHLKGELSGRSKITNNAVAKIRELRINNTTHKEIARLVGCSEGIVQSVLARDSWSHI